MSESITPTTTQPQITTVLFTRHEEHENQVLLLDARERAIARGKVLKEAGYNISRMVLSPAPRAIATALAMCEGYGNADMPLTLEPRIGDFKSDPRTPAGSLKELKELAKKLFGNTEDSSLAGAMLKMPILHEYLYHRASEGAKALQDMAIANPGEVQLVTSHGVARMEIVLRYLQGYRGAELLDIGKELVPRGQVNSINFNVVGTVATFKSGISLPLLPDDVIIT